MATVTKSEMEGEIKLEPKEQREPKKPSSKQQEKPSLKGSPISDKIEVSSPIKKENPVSPKSSPEQPKPQETKKSEKKDLPPGAINEAHQQGTDSKPTSDKSSPKKTIPEKVNASSANSVPANVSFKPAEAANSSNSEKVESPKVGRSSPNGMTSTNDSQNNKPSNNSNSKPSNTKEKSQTAIKETADDGKSLKSKDCGPADKKETKSELIKEDKSSSKVENYKKSEKVEEPAKVPLVDITITAPATENKNEEKANEEQINDTNNNKTVEVRENCVPKLPGSDGIHESKNSLRSEIWNRMFRSSMLAFRKPCNYRIPHFKGDIVSAGRLSTLEIFQKAKVVKVSLDKAHESVRLQVIEAGKEMIVGCPGLREAVFLHIKPPMEPSKSSNKLASSRIGIGHIGMALDFSSGTQADLVIVGSVAVDRTGLRVGKGEGFADLEYALLKKLGGIAPDAPIVTVVHDSQVYDTLPENLFKEHDVPADYIVTPSEVIEINPKRKHPDLMWNILSNRRVNSIPIIKQLMDREQTRDGTTIALKEEDTDSEELEQIAKRKRYFMRRKSYSTGSQRGRGQMVNRQNYIRDNMGGGRIRRYSAPSERIYQQPMMMMPQFRQTRTFRNQAASVPRYNFNQQLNMKQFWMPRNFQNGGRRRSRLEMFRPRYSVDFSLKVQGLTNEMRVRDLKSAINQRGIRPRDISWLPHKGIAFLHFAKQKNNIVEPQPLPPATDTNSVLASLKDLIVKAGNGPETNVQIEAAATPNRRVHFNV